MIQELGESLLWSVIVMSGVRFVLPFLGYRLPILVQWRGLQMTAWCEFMGLSIAFGSLITAYVVSDFRLQNVAENSHTALSVFYRIAATWSNHEGSLLLWLWLFGFYGVTMTRSSPQNNQKALSLYRLRLQNLALAFHGLLVFMIGFYLLKTSNPFARAHAWVQQGHELNPLLQDPALAIHPPILYMGYAGFSVPFCYALAAAWIPKASEHVSHEWVTYIRNTTLWAWSFLTLGIGLGSLWAYYELGWGGWWFWDPVENASLLPWLTGTALIHSVHVCQKTQGLLKTSWFLAVMGFILCMLGTVLVRSGALSTVHAFTYDATRGFHLMLMMGGMCGFALVSALKIYKHSAAPLLIPLINRQTLLTSGIYLFITLMLTVLVGTLYPLIMDVLNAPSVSVGAPYFEKTFVPIALLIIMGMAMVPFIGWRSQNLNALFQNMHWGIGLLMVGCCAIFLGKNESITRALIGGMGYCYDNRWLGL